MICDRDHAAAMVILARALGGNRGDSPVEETASTAPLVAVAESRSVETGILPAKWIIAKQVCQMDNCQLTMKASDIPDDTALMAVRLTQGMHGVPYRSTLWDIQDKLSAYPPKVVTAKLKSLIRRGHLKGCTCGCRGDFELVDDGLIQRESPGVDYQPAFGNINLPMDQW